MRYALLIYSDGTALKLPEDELKRVEARFGEVLALPNTGPSLRLQGVETATTVRGKNGEAVLTDGPFVESKEYLGGLIVFDGANLDEAIDVATRLQSSKAGISIEVRPIWEQ